MTKFPKRLVYPALAVFAFVLAITVVLSAPIKSSAASSNPSVSAYEMGEDTGYYYGISNLVSNMSFGSPTAGTMSISGDVSEKTSFRGSEAYGVTGSVTFDYVYNNSVLCQDDADQWEI